MTSDPDIVAGLITGLSREIARELAMPVKTPQVRQAAWFIANGGYGLSFEVIARSQGLTKQTVHEGVQRAADACETRSYERALLRVADVFEVAL